MQRQVTAVVVGGGPSGIAVVGNLLDICPKSTIAWVDPHFQGGRINAKYTEVPSNTKVGFFLDYAKAVKPFRDIAEATPRPNAITTLQDLPQEETCSLGYAGDMLNVLSEGLLKDSRISSWKGIVTEAERNSTSSAWSLAVRDEARNSVERLEAPLVVYCTGSFPTTVPFPTGLSRQPELLDLDIALKPSLLAETLPKDRDICIGVVGASHSAILVLMNLYTLSQDSHPRLRVRWFSRATQLKYAEDKGDWILYDNTGLKGRAAQFARENLDGDRLLESDVGKIITRVDCSGGRDQEIQAMLKVMPECDRVVQAVGYTRNTLPSMKQDIEFDHQTGGFTDKKTNQPVPGLFGAGIAFPERVVDPYGNVEYSVGFIKFMRFLKRVVPNWVESSLK
ncbi:pyridine nucleotide-disulfide oxidoreductase-domain-containing protein [Hypomontagnella submonticulosa]|nr:pyridine nucleotide-disulfide oxidoreductase-domain-containing protein [Hypomontagnella submonticulosa]